MTLQVRNCGIQRQGYRPLLLSDAHLLDITVVNTESSRGQLLASTSTGLNTKTILVHRQSISQGETENDSIINPTPMPPPPTTTTTTHPTCTAYLDPIPGPHLLIQRNALCHACFRHLFALAATSESSYPASWAGHPLSAPRYAHILGHELLTTYNQKATEYACPAQERVYCSRTDPPRRPEACGRFVSQWREARVRACVRCEACAWYACLRCEESFSTSDVAGANAAIEHQCDPHRDREFEERAFQGLKRGREWQVCPNEKCKRRVELSDGCNHVRCVCREHFCFICGMPVRDEEGHWWKEGGCPRFGHKGGKRAIYDENDLYDDNGDVVDDERAGEIQRLEDGEDAAAWRAFDFQMQIVDEFRRHLEETEAARLRDRDRERHGQEADTGNSSGLRRHQRVRRRRPREAEGLDDERQRERHHAHRRNQENPAQALDERERRRHGGLRAFLSNVVDATGQVISGRRPARDG